jgi:hypothetical protein
MNRSQSIGAPPRTDSNHDRAGSPADPAVAAATGSTNGGADSASGTGTSGIPAGDAEIG